MSPDGTSWGCRRLGVRYGATVALEEVSFEVAAGTVAAVVGGDGAGKTSLLRALAGTVRPAAGTVRRPDERRLGYVSAGPGVWTDLTVDENLSFSGRAYGLSAGELDRRVGALLERTGLAGARDRLAGRLSGGMRQKLALAMAVAHEPDLLILDEPTTGVDPVSRAELWRLLAASAAGGAAVVVATTYLDEAERAATVLVLDRGRGLLAGTPDEVVAATPGLVVDAADPPRRHPVLAPGAALAGLVARRLDPAGHRPGHPRPGGRGDRGPAPRGPAVGGMTPPEGPGGVPGRPGGPGAGQRRGRDQAVRGAAGRRRRRPGGGRGRGGRADRGQRLRQDDADPHAARPARPHRRPRPAVRRAAVAPDPGPPRLRAPVPRPLRRPHRGREPGLLGRRLRQPATAVLEGELAEARDVLVRELPLGLRRRAAFAIALGHHPDLLVLDEPTSGVDPLQRARLWETIRATAEHGAGVLVTTHHLGEAEQCDRLVVLAAGRVVAAGSLPEIVGDTTAAEVRTPIWEAAFTALDLARLPVSLVGRTLRVPGNDAAASPASWPTPASRRGRERPGQLRGDLRGPRRRAASRLARRCGLGSLGAGTA